MDFLRTIRHKGLDRLLRVRSQATSSQAHYGLLRPLATQKSTGLSRLTLVPSRVRVPNIICTQKTKKPINDGLFCFGAP